MAFAHKSIQGGRDLVCVVGVSWIGVVLVPIPSLLKVVTKGFDILTAFDLYSTCISHTHISLLCLWVIEE